MRNSEAQRYARWSAGITGLLVVLVIGVYLQRLYQAKQVEKKAPPPVPPTVEQRSAQFSFSKVEGQRTIFTVRSSQATQYKGSSRNLLEDVSIIVYGKKGERHYTLSKSACARPVLENAIRRAAWQPTNQTWNSSKRDPNTGYKLVARPMCVSTLRKN